MTGQILVLLYRTRVLHFVLMLALIVLLEALGSLAPMLRDDGAVSAGPGYQDFAMAGRDGDLPEGGAAAQGCAQPQPRPRHVVGLFAPAVASALELLFLRQDR